MIQSKEPLLTKEEKIQSIEFVLKSFLSANYHIFICEQFERYLMFNRAGFIPTEHYYDSIKLFPELCNMIEVVGIDLNPKYNVVDGMPWETNFNSVESNSFKVEKLKEFQEELLKL